MAWCTSIDLVSVPSPGADPAVSRFVGTLLHPAFWTNNSTRQIEIDEDPVTGEYRVIRSRVVRDYMDVKAYKGLAMPGQPTPQVRCPCPPCRTRDIFIQSIWPDLLSSDDSAAPGPLLQGWVDHGRARGVSFHRRGSGQGADRVHPELYSDPGHPRLSREKGELAL